MGDPSIGDSKALVLKKKTLLHICMEDLEAIK